MIYACLTRSPLIELFDLFCKLRLSALTRFIPITDFKMTRFLLSLKDCVDFTWLAFNKMYGGEIFVKKIPSIKIKDLADAVNQNGTLPAVDWD